MTVVVANKKAEIKRITVCQAKKIFGKTAS
jgi:hypothetical protein